MKFIFAQIFIFLFSISSFAQNSTLPPGHPQLPRENSAPTNESPAPAMVAIPAGKAEQQIIQTAEKIDTNEIQRIAMHQNGRIKPLDTLAREQMLFINGSNSRWGLNAVQLYLAILIDPASAFLEVIEVRDPELRVQLGYPKSKRFFSSADLENSALNDMALPLFKKQETNSKSLSESEKKILETYQQWMVLRNIQTGENFLSSVDFTAINNKPGSADMAMNPEIQGLAKNYLTSLSQADFAKARTDATALVAASRSQQAPEMFQHYLQKLDLEIFYNNARLFFIASILSMLLGALLLLNPIQKKIPQKFIIGFFLFPILIEAWAIGIRVYITKFAPVTNMYGTMIWVSMGVMFFSLLLYALYRNRMVSGIMLIGSGLILLLTEKTPLILSPDLDPIVAVLRSNYWLSTHVTTITISYAAFTIAMILGNVALVRVWTHADNKAFFKEYAHYAYRMIQLGVFLLTMGIILGGIWADYSWGRFWGWDPKETWALIADLGFLAILHARLIGWVNDFTLLAWCPAAYLLVIMAWYGVNFVLAAGLHSYGFSSGGATMIAVFVSVQVGLLAASWLKHKYKKVNS